jgi:micrococcal nuclease
MILAQTGISQEFARYISKALVALLALVSSCARADSKEAHVLRVIDGDTVKLTDGRSVRYIGIDTPETKRRVGGKWVPDAEYFGKEATLANKNLVEGKDVSMEFDVQTHDRYGRLLAYVYVDGRMVNELLLEEGFASILTVPPNVKYVERFKELSRKARQEKRGLWAKKK